MGISLVLLRTWPLRQDDRDQMGGSGRQVRRAPAGDPRAAHRLAVHSDRQPLARAVDAARAANPYGGPRALPQQTKLTVRFTDRSL